MEPIRKEIIWNPGPANGGTGTAGNTLDGTPKWWDGQLLLLLVNFEGYHDEFLVRVNADGNNLSFLDPDSGNDEFPYSDTDIWWWAVLDDALPSME